MVRALWLGCLALPLAAIVIWGCSAQPTPSAAPARATTATEADLGASRYARPTAVNDPAALKHVVPSVAAPQDGTGPGLGGDKYAYLEETGFVSVKDSPL